MSFLVRVWKPWHGNADWKQLISKKLLLCNIGGLVDEKAKVDADGTGGEEPKRTVGCFSEDDDEFPIL